eukprot:4422762-Amphidinium_carterae.1
MCLLGRHAIFLTLALVFGQWAHLRNVFAQTNLQAKDRSPKSQTARGTAQPLVVELLAND